MKIKKEILVLFIILILGFLVRLYKFNAPIADWHSWRQSDTSAVSKVFVDFGFDVFHPRYYDLSNVPSGIYDNPNGYRFVEFPIYNIAQAGFYKLFPIFTIEQWGRLVTIFSSLIASVFLYLIVKRYRSVQVAMFSVFFFLFIPYNVYYSRVILPDMSMVAATLCAIYFFDLWLEAKKLTIFNLNFFIALILTIVSILLKPYALFFLLPMAYLVLEKFGITFVKKWQFWVFAVISVLPFFLWRLWELRFPEGIPQSGWLLNGNNIRFKGAFFHWIFAERLGKLILGYWGLPLLILGFLLKLSKKDYFFFLSFLFSSLLYISVFATGNVQHDYYQILIMPSLCIFLALGSEFLTTFADNFNGISSKTILVVCILFMLSFGWYQIRDYYNIQHSSIVRAGIAIDKLIPKTARVIVPYEGDTTPLYLMGRRGWPSLEKPTEELIKMGADYFVILNPKKENFDIGRFYKIISFTPDYILVDLHQKP